MSSLTSPWRIGAVAALALTACGNEADTAHDPSTHTSSPTASESTPVAAPKCPAGLGPANADDAPEAVEPATELPDLGMISTAWLCAYSPKVGSGSGEEESQPWESMSEAVELTGPELETLQNAVTGMSIPPKLQACTMDLGPRSLVLMQVDGGTVGLVMDHFGCRSVRLTSDPESAAAGTTSDLGTVTGVLNPGDELRTLLEQQIEIG